MAIVRVIFGFLLKVISLFKITSGKILGVRFGVGTVQAVLVFRFRRFL